MQARVQREYETVSRRSRESRSASAFVALAVAVVTNRDQETLERSRVTKRDQDTLERSSRIIRSSARSIALERSKALGL